MTTPLEYIMGNLRERDIEEILEHGSTPDIALSLFESPSVLTTYFVKTRPIAVMAFHALTPRTITASFMATDEFEEVGREIYRWGVKVAKPTLLQMGYVRAECRVMEGYDDATRLLEHFGFELEARLAHYGRSKAFLQYAWTADARAVDAAAKRQQSLSKRNGPWAG